MAAAVAAQTLPSLPADLFLNGSAADINSEVVGAGQAMVLSCVQSIAKDARHVLPALTAACASDDLQWRARGMLVKAVMLGMQSEWKTGDYASFTAAAFQGVRGWDLYRMKSLVDEGEDRHTLYYLLFRTMEQGQRSSTMQHFAAAAGTLDDEDAPARPPNLLATDIDDTLYPYLFDASSASGRLYPGVEAFHNGILGGPLPGRMAIVTARPGVARGITRSSLRDMGLGRATVLTGTLASLLSRSVIAREKVGNLTTLTALWPEARLVWVGDTGQGDAVAGGEMLAGYAGDPRSAPLVLMHDIVLSSRSQTPKTPLAGRRAWAAGGILTFDSYVGAAALAVQAGAMAPTAALDVLEAACTALDVHPPSIGFDPAVVGAWRAAVTAEQASLPRLPPPLAGACAEAFALHTPTAAAPPPPPAVLVASRSVSEPGPSTAPPTPPAPVAVHSGHGSGQAAAPPAVPAASEGLPVGCGAYALDGALEPGQAAKAHVGCPTGVPGVAVVWAPRHNVLRHGGVGLAGAPAPSSDHSVYPGHKGGVAPPPPIAVTPLVDEELQAALTATLPLPVSVPDPHTTPSWLHTAAGAGVAAAARDHSRQSLRDNMRCVEMQDAAGRLVALLALGACGGGVQ